MGTSEGKKASDAGMTKSRNMSGAVKPGPEANGAGTGGGAGTSIGAGMGSGGGGADIGTGTAGSTTGKGTDTSREADNMATGGGGVSGTADNLGGVSDQDLGDSASRSGKGDRTRGT